jgi:2,3-bisphosphoglycerate-independent phosphoglycerate mutase
MKRTIVLIILDGWGIGRDDETNPIYMVKPETLGRLAVEYPLTSLQASGISVGLPWGEVGNSEVGHLTLGAGKVIYQYYPKITLAIRDKTFFENEALKSAFAHAKENGSAVNLVGLLSKGNVHASIEHLQALLTMAVQEGVTKVNLHLFADGKDMPPRTVESLLKLLPQDKLATLIGRYYAMDREGNWSLTENAYRLMTEDGPVIPDLAAAIAANYAKGLNEEFLPPLRLAAGKAIGDNDAVIFFNYREDSIRQIADAFVGKEFTAFARKDIKNLKVVTLTHYKDGFDAEVAFAADKVLLPLGKVLADQGLVQLRLAETYKYAHVTYFFNGYVEEKFTNEYRVLIPSEAMPHPDEHPQMMAVAITDRLIGAIEERAYDFILVNYANGDTIAHSGNYKASEEAVRVVDRELARVVKAAEATNAVLVITSDHGHVEELINPQTGRIETQHAGNPVPLYLMAPEYKGRQFVNQATFRQETLGILSDVAPTILELMQIQKPEDMTGESLLRNLI